MEEHKTLQDFKAKYDYDPEIEKSDPHAKKLVWKVKNKENGENFIAKSFRFNTRKDFDSFLLSTKDIMRAKHDNLIDTIEFFIDVTESSNNYKVIFIQEYIEKNVLTYVESKEETESNPYLPSGETRKLLHQSLNLLEYIQRNKLYFKEFNKKHFFITEYENFKLSGLVETYVYLVDLDKFPFSTHIEKSNQPTSHQKIEVGNDNDKDITELDHVFEDLIVENPYKDDALDLCICLIDILTLGKTKPSDLYNEGRRRAIIDQIKLYTKIDFVNVLHFMCSDSVNLRSDFVNLKKLMMNTTNKKSKEFKFERIFAEEGINLDDNKSNKTQDTNTKEDKPEATEVLFNTY